MKLVVGLGNPGPEYARTRHNVGYLVADALARDLGASFAAGKFAADVAEGRIAGERVLVVKPRTFMNHSGEAVGPLLRFWKAELADLAVVHDDLELEPFRVQVKVGGGHAGHNGLKSLNAHLGSPEYARVRVGVGRPPPQMDPADWVLGRFGKGDEPRLAECVEWATAAARTIVEQGAVKAMNEFNRRVKSPG
ncbi:aminoacyl-tRNA hydrolase [Anaeromyxobacter paludicola]|uniref:Peptidyl-tRNA hydrolase n=1 Tax=Anaeromyxobacter paludicola TaxID=2918171 RepID=A0ABM7XBN8_9BACT|nr:aminoacyl-tRNA hydrolase [Anaeromyxobacter paludicola]BDG09280.1 peptidyl-tRNA hydrolase [Anaeromyxobacter paludicola]